MISVQRIDHKIIETDSFKWRTGMQNPCRATIGGAQDSNAQRRNGIAFACSRINYERIAGVESYRTDRDRGLIVGSRLPVLSCILRLPYTTGARTDQDVIGIARINRHRDNTTGDWRLTARTFTICLSVRDAERPQRAPALLDRSRRCRFIKMRFMREGHKVWRSVS